MKKRYWILKGLIEIQTTFIATEQIYYWNGSYWQYGVCDYGKQLSQNENYFNEKYCTSSWGKDIINGQTNRSRTLIKLIMNKRQFNKFILHIYYFKDIWHPTKLYVQEITQEFDPKTVTWNTQPPYGNLVATIQTPSPPEQGWVEIDLTQSINSWFDRFNFPPSYVIRIDRDYEDEYGNKCIHFKNEKSDEEELQPYIEI